MVTLSTPAIPKVTMEIVLLILGLAIGAAVGFNLGQRHRPKVMATNAADAVVWFLRAVRSSPLPRETVMAVERVVSLAYDDDTARYIHVRLEEPPVAG